MRIGYIRVDQRMGEAPQREVLATSGLAERDIFVETGPDELNTLEWIITRKIRPTARDTVEVSDLHRLCSNSECMAETIKRIIERGANVVDVRSGARSDAIATFVIAVQESVGFLSGRLSRADRRRIARAGAAASPVTKKKTGRMPKADAIKIWRNPEFRTEEAIELINADKRYRTPYTKPFAYRNLGPRDIPSGPRGPHHIRKVRLKAQRESESGAIYFCRADGTGPVKIGFATDVQSRIKSLQTSHHGELRLVGFIEGTRFDEGDLHRRFRNYHIRGEWFRVEGAVKKFLDSLPKLPENKPEKRRRK